MTNDDYLDLIYNEVKALGFVSNQYDFSVLCGRTPAWFSSIKARRLPMTTDAALTLSYNIRKLTADIVDIRQYEFAMALSDALIMQAQHRIAGKLTVKNELML